MSKFVTKEMWSKRITVYICSAICLIVWNVIASSGIACLCSVIFFCQASMTGYLYGDKYEQYSQSLRRDSNEKEKWFSICFVTGFISISYNVFLKASYIGITNIIVFILSIIFFTVAFFIVLKKIYNNCRTLFNNFKLVFGILSLFFGIVFISTFIVLNVYLDTECKLEKVNVHVVKHVDYWKIPISRTQYCYCDSEGVEHMVTHIYLSLDGQKTKNNITIKSGNGLFGLGYEDVWFMESYPIERLIRHINETD